MLNGRWIDTLEKKDMISNTLSTWRESYLFCVNVLIQVEFFEVTWERVLISWKERKMK